MIGEDPKGIPNNLMPYITPVSYTHLETDFKEAVGKRIEKVMDVRCV